MFIDVVITGLASSPFSPYSAEIFSYKPRDQRVYCRSGDFRVFRFSRIHDLGTFREVLTCELSISMIVALL